MILNREAALNVQLQTLPTSTPVSLRQRELEAGRVVLRAIGTGDPFLLRRADHAVAELGSEAVRRPLRRALECARNGEADPAAAAAGLLGYGAVLERHAEYLEAEAVYGAALEQLPGDSRVALHAARAARKAGRREAALSLYRRAGETAGGDIRMHLLVRIGEALVSAEPERALTAAASAARAAGDRDALGVALEERARIRPTVRHSNAAVRDLLAAAVRYRDAQDRVRVLHRLAELLTARGDLPAAREALLAALDLVGEGKRGHTLQRLRTVARSMGDAVELRRSRGQGGGTLVSLAPPPARSRTQATTLQPRVRRVRDMIAASASAVR
jgi:tetratricopeptide (TPR) repeat protein